MAGQERGTQVLKAMMGKGTLDKSGRLLLGREASCIIGGGASTGQRPGNLRRRRNNWLPVCWSVPAPLAELNSSTRTCLSLDLIKSFRLEMIFLEFLDFRLQPPGESGIFLWGVVFRFSRFLFLFFWDRQSKK